MQCTTTFGCEDNETCTNCWWIGVSWSPAIRVKSGWKYGVAGDDEHQAKKCCRQREDKGGGIVPTATAKGHSNGTPNTKTTTTTERHKKHCAILWGGQLGAQLLACVSNSGAPVQKIEQSINNAFESTPT
eukprot:2485846-Amphidinium_carterae.1